MDNFAQPDPCPLDPPARSADKTPAAEADAFARLFSLPPLVAEGEPELRVWGEEYMFGNIRGLVVKGDQVTSYFLSEQDHASPPKIRSRTGVGPSPVLGMMDQLATLDGLSWSCLALDGGRSVVDGRANGHRFSFRELNGSAYENPRGKLLEKAFELIGPTPE